MFPKSQNAKTIHLSAKNASRAPESYHPSNLSVRMAFVLLEGYHFQDPRGLLPWGSPEISGGSPWIPGRIPKWL